MKAPIKNTIILILAAALTSTAFASEIYKWTDEDGNVHYGDRPTSPQSERLAIRSRPTNPAHVQAQTQAMAESRNQKTEQKQEAAAGQPTQQEIAAQAAEKTRKCDDYRGRLEKMLQSRRLYRENEDGERVYLDEEEILAARERVQTQVEEYCSP